MQYVQKTFVQLQDNKHVPTTQAKKSALPVPRTLSATPPHGPPAPAPAQR